MRLCLGHGQRRAAALGVTRVARVAVWLCGLSWIAVSLAAALPSRDMWTRPGELPL